jgi:hypothetical protein
MYSVLTPSKARPNGRASAAARPTPSTYPGLLPATVVTASDTKSKARMTHEYASAMKRVGDAALGLVFPAMPKGPEKSAFVPVPSAEPVSVPEALPPAATETEPPAETARMRVASATNSVPA